MLIPIEPRPTSNSGPLCLAPSLLPITDAARAGLPMHDAIKQIVASMGFDSVFYLSIHGTLPLREARQYAWTSSPSPWMREYDARGYSEIDPRIAYGWATWPPPLVWDQRLGQHNARVRRFLEHAALNGIGSGLVIYFRDEWHRAMVAFDAVGRTIGENRRHEIEARIPEAVYLATVLHSMLEQDVAEQRAVGAKPGEALSARERACLEFAARGMTSADIGVKLGITARTADFHFRNIVSKLGALNRQEAVARAIAHRMIRVDKRRAGQGARRRARSH
jgi:DNA-binding CsgD family transcriptional regulator